MLSLYFLSKYALLMKKNVTEISSEAMELLIGYDFPGNVRELENIIERGVAITNCNTIESTHLPEDLREMSFRTFRKKNGRILPLEEHEKDYILWVLRESIGNQTLAAQTLGIDRVSLWRKLKKYQISTE